MIFAWQNVLTYKLPVLFCGCTLRVMHVRVVRTLGKYSSGFLKIGAVNQMTQFKKEQNKHLNRIKCVNSRENANDWKLEKEVNFFCF